MQTALALLLAASDVLGGGAAFEADGVRVDGTLVRGISLEVRRIEGGSVLVSGAAVEPLSTEVRVTIEGGRAIVLEPGVRVARSGGSYVLSSHGSRPIRVRSGSRTASTPSPVSLTPVAGGWDLGGSRIEGEMLVVLAPLAPAAQQPPQQKDPDKELKELKDAARLAEEALKTEAPPEPRRVRSRRIFQGDPSATADPLDFRTLTGVPLASPVGP